MSRDRSRRASWTAIATIAAQFTGKLAAFFSIPLTLGYLGQEQYGLWLTVSAFIGWLALADLGLGSGLLTRLAAAYAKRNETEQRQLLTSTLAAQAMIALVLILGFIVLFPLLDWRRIFNVTSLDTINVLPVMVILVFVTFIVQFILSVVPNTYRALQEGYVTQIWTAVGSLLSLIAVVIVTRVYGNVPLLVAALAGVPVLVLLGNTIWMYRWHKPYLRPSFGDISWRLIKSVASLGIQYSVLALCYAATAQTAYLIIAQYLGIAEVTPYGVAMKFYALVQAVGLAVLTPLWPAYAEAITSKDEGWIKQIHRGMLRLNALLWGIFGLGFVLLGPTAIRLWAGPGAVPSQLLLAGVAFQGLVSAETAVFTTLLNGAGLARQQFPSVIISSITTLGLMLLMGAWWSSSGVVWGNALGSCLALLLFARITPRLVGAVMAGTSAN